MSYGANQYRRSAGPVLSARETEAAAFVFVNRLLEQASDSGDRIKALAKNQELWSMLMKDIGSSNNALPEILKKDLATVGLLAIRTSIAAMSDTRSLTSLMELNRDMIEGLRTIAEPHPVTSRSGSLAYAG